MEPVTIAPPKHKVDLIIEGKSHLYDVTAENVTVRYPGVTGFLSVINKPALVPWAKKAWAATGWTRRGPSGIFFNKGFLR